MTQAFGDSGGVDEEALREAQEELARLEQAESFSAPDAPPVQPAYIPPVQVRRSYSTPSSQTVSSQARSVAAISSIMDGPVAVQLSADPKTLEDLYSMFPVGDGDYRLRIERKQPTYHHTPNGAVKIAGFIADLDEPVSLTDFAYRFGGGKYEVSVVGPPSGSQRVDVSGNKIVRLLKKVEVQVPGPSKLNHLPIESKEEQMPVQHIPVAANPEVEKFRLQLEQDRQRQEAEDRRAREDRERAATAEAVRAPEKFLVAVREQNEKSIEEVKRLAQQQHDLLKAQNEQLRQDYFKTRDEADKVRAQLLQVQQEADRRARESETEKIGALKQEHEREIRRIHEERATQIDKLSQQHRDDVTRLTNSHVEEMRRVESAASKERESMVRDSERRESQLSKDAERERVTMKETYESRIAQMKETYELRLRDLMDTTKREIVTLRESRDREVDSMKQAHDREVAAVRSQYEMQTSVARDTATLRIENVNSELARMREEIARLSSRAESAEREAMDLRASSHKSPIEAINEAKTMVEIIGWGPKEEGSGGPAEEEFDWKKTLAKAGMGLVEKLPEISRDIMATRSQAQQQPGPDQRQMAMGAGPRQMMMGPGQQPPRMLPQPRQAPSFVQPFPSQQMAAPQRPQPQPQPQQFYQTAPQQFYQSAPPQSGFAPPWAQAAPAPMAVPQAPQPPQSPVQSASMPSEAAMVAAAMQNPMPQQQPMAVEPQQAPAAPSAVQLQPEHIAEFLQELEGAIRGGVIPPGLFAKGFIDRVGPDAARAVTQMLSADALIQQVQAQDTESSTAIVTRDGQRYVRELFTAVQSQLG